jgi:hypothetical protein
MAETPDQVLRSVVGLLVRIRDDSADLERLALGNKRIVDLSRNIDVDAVNAMNALEALRRRLASEKK